MPKTNVWSIILNNEDKYWVFATSAIEAERIIRTIHYDNITWREFRKTYKPKITKTQPNQKITITDILRSKIR